MKGVQYLFDKKGRPQAVLIDLKRNRKLWEDIQDILVARERLKEPRIPLADVLKKSRNGKKAWSKRKSPF
jgi:hypothetical protein